MEVGRSFLEVLQEVSILSLLPLPRNPGRPSDSPSRSSFGSGLSFVSEWIWTEVARTYVLNEKLREEIRKHNPWALHRMIEVLYEANRRGY